MHSVESALTKFIEDARTILNTPGTKPEVSLYGRFEAFLAQALAAVTESELGISQQADADDLGVPDYRVNLGSELLGWVELKAVVGKPLGSLKGHDLHQKQRFVPGLHNVLYSNGWEWELYQDGARIARATFDQSLFEHDSLVALEPGAVDRLVALLALFADFRLTPYATLEQGVSALAQRARGLKAALIELGEEHAGDHLAQLQSDFRSLLYRHGQKFTWERFIDSYVQIAAFGALLWRLEAKTPISLDLQVGIRTGSHPLLAQCLSILWSPASHAGIVKPMLDSLCSTVNLIPLEDLEAPPGISGPYYKADPIIHAYEPFFQRYDPAARESNGVYYTPAAIVQQIVSGVDRLLRSSLGLGDGVLSDSARFLDPATGTGTFLLGLAREIAERATGQGLPPDHAVREALESRVSAFELFPGPYAIAHYRFEALLAATGGPATKRLPIYLADTLAAPEAGQLPISGFGPAGDEIVLEREEADEVKVAQDLLVIFGNPPYERLSASGKGFPAFTKELMQEIVKATPVENRADLKSATDLYVAFWAWSLWALRSPKQRYATSAAPSLSPTENHGMVAFVTNRTWILGPSLVGLRRLVREGAKEVWICDLGGDSRGSAGARSFEGSDENVFGIQTGVAIAWVVFDREWSGTTTVRYRRIYGDKNSKLSDLTKSFDAADYGVVAGDDLFVPALWPPPFNESPTLGEFFAGPALTGVQSARDSSRYSPWATHSEGVYSESQQKGGKALRHGSLGAWAELSSVERSAAWSTAQSRRQGRQAPAPSELDPAKVHPALYRPLDFRYVYDDPAWIDWYRDDLHSVFADGPTPCLVSLPRDFGAGPLAAHTNQLMDQHAFKGQAGGKAVFPLWRPVSGAAGLKAVGPNRLSGLSDGTILWARGVFEHADVELHAYDYVLAVLSAPTYAETYWKQLEVSGPRIPLSPNAPLAQEFARIGATLREAWEQASPIPAALRWAGAGHGPLGSCVWSDGNLTFKNGRVLEGVPIGAWNFSVSLYPVLRNWFGAREDWTLTISEAKECRAVVASTTVLAQAATELDALFLELIGMSAPQSVDSPIT